MIRIRPEHSDDAFAAAGGSAPSPLRARTRGSSRPPMTRPWRVLLAEDDDEMRALLARSLRSQGYEVIECPDGWTMLRYTTPYLLSLEMEDEVRFDLVISDLRMPVLTGLEILDGSRSVEGFPPFILMTAFGNEEIHELARRAGAVAWYEKPFDIDDLLDDVRRILPPAGKRGAP